MENKIPLVLKYNYDDIYFKLKISIDQDITEYTEKRECFDNFFIYTNIKKDKNFSKFCDLIEEGGKIEIESYSVNIECLENINLSDNKFKINDLKIFIKEFLLPKIKFYVSGNFDSSVYSATQKISKKENLGYTVENHRKLYRKELSKRSFTPVEIYLFMKFDFNNIYGF